MGPARIRPGIPDALSRQASSRLRFSSGSVHRRFRRGLSVPHRHPVHLGAESQQPPSQLQRMQHRSSQFNTAIPRRRQSLVCGERRPIKVVGRVRIEVRPKRQRLAALAAAMPASVGIGRAISLLSWARSGCRHGRHPPQSGVLRCSGEAPLSIRNDTACRPAA